MTAALDSFWVRYSQKACDCRPDYLCSYCRRRGVRQAPPDLLYALRNLRAAGLIGADHV
jgi:hypothetical protein